jgi:hypothetical protein
MPKFKYITLKNICYNKDVGTEQNELHFLTAYCYILKMQVFLDHPITVRTTHGVFRRK